MFAATETRDVNICVAPCEQQDVLLLTVRDMGNGVCRIEQSAWISVGAVRSGLHAASETIPAAVLDALGLITNCDFSAPRAAYRFLSEGLTEYMVWNQ